MFAAHEPEGGGRVGDGDGSQGGVNGGVDGSFGDQRLCWLG